MKEGQDLVQHLYSDKLFYISFGYFDQIKYQIHYKLENVIPQIGHTNVGYMCT